MKKCGRTDMERHYMWTAYNNAVDDAKQHMNVAGVRECMANAEQHARNYQLRMGSFLEKERLTENELYTAYEKSVKRYNICFWGVVGLILFNVLARSSHLSILRLLADISILVYIVALIVMRLKASMAEKRYRDYSNDILQKIDAINNDFLRIVNSMTADVDAMYLASLDPAHREMVLMRREQAEHNREMKHLEIQRQRTENERLDEARRARQAQERLLAIEEERERRLRR